MPQHLPEHLTSPPSLWSEKRLLIPTIPWSLEDKLEFYEWGHIATIQEPDPRSDYMFDASIVYLARKIPDQYVLSYAGHGINSYSANFRLAHGDFAIMFQIGFGGYTDEDSSLDAWNEAVVGFATLKDIYPDESPQEPTRHREQLFCYSNFRDDFKVGSGTGPTRLTRAGGNKWESQKTYATWDSFRDAQKS